MPGNYYCIVLLDMAECHCDRNVKPSHASELSPGSVGDVLYEFGMHVSESDFVQARYLHLRPRPVFRVLGLFSLIAYFIATVFATYQAVAQGESYVSVTVLVGLGLALFWWYRCSLRTSGVKLYRQRADLGELLCSLSKEGWSVSSSRGTGTLPFADFRKWRENHSLILLYPSNDLYYVVVKDCLEREALDFLRQRVIHHLGDAT